MSWAARWAPALLVALGAAVATAHGLYEVAHASRVPGPIAWLYPLVTDGLAMVAYSATGRLSGKSAGYAWTCVVLAAGLSGLAQAVYLAADTVIAAPVLRFGVGAWPAIACALVAHLLHLIVTADHQNQHGQHDGPGERDGEADEPGRAAATTPALAPGQEPAPAGDPALALTVAAGTTAELDADADRAGDDSAGEQDGQDRTAGDGADGEPDDQDGDEQDSGDGRVRLLVALLTGGADVTGPQAAALLSHQAAAPVSDRTARRLLATARESTRDTSEASDSDQQPLEQAAGRARLVLLPTGTSTTSTNSSTSSDSDEGDPR